MNRAIFISKNLHVTTAALPLLCVLEYHDAAKRLFAEMQEMFPGFSPETTIAHVSLNPFDDVFKRAPDRFPERTMAIYREVGWKPYWIRHSSDSPTRRLS
jgi:hypothetical protein